MEQKSFFLPMQGWSDLAVLVTDMNVKLLAMRYFLALPVIVIYLSNWLLFNVGSSGRQMRCAALIFLKHQVECW